MKTIFKTLISFAVAAIAFAACSQDELNTPNSNEPITLKFNITKSTETVEGKALLGTEDNKTFLNWENGDKIGTFSVGTFASSQTTSNNNPGTVDVSGDVYTLNVQTYNAGDITNIYSYFPHSASAGKTKEAAIVTIPESQTMSASGFDADAMPMAGTPVSVDITTTAANTDTPCGTINFSNLGSIINFKIYSSTACDETITSVKYIGENIGGEFTIDLTSIDPESEASLALTAHDPINAITTNCASHPSLQSKTSKDNAIDVYMVVAPDTYANSQVVVTTSAYTYTLNASGAKTYTRSHIKPMYVDIQNGEKGELPAAETWTKVTSSADFTAGTYYILRGDGAYYVPNGTGNPSCVGYSNGDAIVDGMRWIATDSGSGLVFESYTHKGYYLWTTNTGSANTISVAENSTGANASKVWSFAQCEVGNTTYYTATAGESKYLVSYGTSNWRYYGSSNVNNTNIPAEFYKLDESGKQTPTIAFSNPTTSVNVGESVTNVASIDPSSLTVTYSSSNNTVASVDASTGEVTGEAAGTATITAAFAGNDSYYSVTATYDITVVTPASPQFTTVAELNALAGSDEASYFGSLSKAVVSYVPNAGNAIIKDATGSILLYMSDHGLLQGQTFTGNLNVTIKLFNSCAELTACDAAFTGQESTVAPASVNLNDLVGNLTTYQNAYVQVSGLEVTAVSGKNVTVSSGNKTYVVYSSAADATCVVGDILTVTGTIAHYGSNDQIKVWASDDITVTYHPVVSHTVTINQPSGSAGSAGCSISATVGGSQVSSGDSIEEGTVVTITASAGTGYSFTGWTISGAAASDASATSTTFSVGTSDVTVSAAFENNNLQKVTDELDLDFTGVSGTSYVDWSNKTGTSGAKYSGHSAGGNSSIQLRTNDNSSGIITTKSGGKVTKVTVSWNSNTQNNRALSVYGKNSAYSATTDLYDSNKMGTLLGTIVCGSSTVLNVSGDYKYIGMRSSDSAIYMDEIQVEWAYDPNKPAVNLKTESITGVAAAGVVSATASGVYELLNGASNNDVTVTCDGTIVTSASKSATAGDITYTVSANSGSARNGWIKVAYSDDLYEITVGQAANVSNKTYTVEFLSSNMSKGVSSYTGTSFSITDDLTLNITNANNNNLGWNYIKIGGKNGAYTGTITTDAAISEAIKTVTLTIDAITASNVTSIKLYSSNSASSGYTEVGTFAKETGNKSVTISSPATNKYYKIEVVCTKGGSNGLCTISKVVFSNN